MGDATRHRTWQRVADAVAATPKRAAAGVAVVLVVLALGVFFYSPRFSFTEDFLQNMPSKQGYALLEKHFPQGSLAPTSVLMQFPRRTAGIHGGGRRRASASPGVSSAFPTGVADNGRLLSFQVIYKGDPYEKGTLEQIRACATRPRGGGDGRGNGADRRARRPCRPTPGRSPTTTRSWWPSSRYSWWG